MKIDHGQVSNIDIQSSLEWDHCGFRCLFYITIVAIGTGIATLAKNESVRLTGLKIPDVYPREFRDFLSCNRLSYLEMADLIVEWEPSNVDFARQLHDAWRHLEIKPSINKYFIMRYVWVKVHALAQFWTWKDRLLFTGKPICPVLTGKLVETNGMDLRKIEVTRFNSREVHLQCARRRNWPDKWSRSSHPHWKIILYHVIDDKTINWFIELILSPLHYSENAVSMLTIALKFVFHPAHFHFQRCLLLEATIKRRIVKSCARWELRKRADPACSNEIKSWRKICGSGN